jgi:hypothetical protein
MEIKPDVSGFKQDMTFSVSRKIWNVKIYGVTWNGTGCLCESPNPNRYALKCFTDLAALLCEDRRIMMGCFCRRMMMGCFCRRIAFLFGKKEPNEF